ncbi:MAG: DUF3501 family protein [Gemmataceae bacterium]|nr:DUF3501 family protein [Gemmataceae bacterium]
MDALTLEDILPLEEFAARRREFFAAHQRYVGRYRRVRVGPRAALVFENRQTLWYRVQEVLRISRLAEPGRVRQELDLYNRLLPAAGRLQAALLLDVDESRLEEELRPWRELRGEQVALEIGSARFPANLLTCRPEDRAIGAAQWVQFVLDAEARALLADARRPACFRIRTPGYAHDSGPLPDDIRQSLAQDLAPRAPLSSAG